MYWQFFYLPTGANVRIREGFVRLDRIQAIHRDLMRHMPVILRENAMGVLRDWVQVYLGEDLYAVNDLLFRTTARMPSHNCHRTPQASRKFLVTPSATTSSTARTGESSKANLKMATLEHNPSIPKERRPKCRARYGDKTASRGGLFSVNYFCRFRQLFLPVHLLFLVPFLSHSGAVAGDVEFQDDRVVVNGAEKVGHWGGGMVYHWRED